MEKRSEKIEVRVSWSEKQALKQEASARGLTISDLIRDLITTRLNRAEWKYAPIVGKHPRKIISSIMALISGVIIMLSSVSLAQAQDFKLDVSGAFSGEQDRARYVRAFRSSVDMTLGEPAQLTFMADDHQDVEYDIKVSVTEIDKSLYSVSIVITKQSKTVSEIIAEPQLVVEEKQEGRITVGKHFEDGTPFDAVDLSVKVLAR